MSSKPNEQDWQQDFVATNLLAIGYNAWAGYLGGERGVVVCDLNTPSVGMSGATYKTYFIPRRRLAAFLNAWLAAPDTVILQHHHMNGHILQAVVPLLMPLRYGNQVNTPPFSTYKICLFCPVKV